LTPGSNLGRILWARALVCRPLLHVCGGNFPKVFMGRVGKATLELKWTGGGRVGEGRRWVAGLLIPRMSAIQVKTMGNHRWPCFPWGQGTRPAIRGHDDG